LNWLRRFDRVYSWKLPGFRLPAWDDCPPDGVVKEETNL
jgi:hypothetical protein